MTTLDGLTMLLVEVTAHLEVEDRDDTAELVRVQNRLAELVAEVARAERSAVPVPEHKYVPSGSWLGRRGLAFLAQVTGVWRVLPGRCQGWLCDCPIDRGETPGGAA